MAAPHEERKGKSFAEKLQSLPRTVLFVILIVVCSVPLFIKGIKIPNKPAPAVIDLYAKLMEIPPGSSVLIQSDWTNSTRAESAGHMEALLRFLMRREIKFAMYSVADPQAPQVYRDTVARINQERKLKGQRVYERWSDWVNLGFFPDGRSHNNAMATDLRKAFAGRMEPTPDGKMMEALQSPVFASLQSISDCRALIIISASDSFDTLVERLSGKVPILAGVTGIMGPESVNYYVSGQVNGLAVGIKGVYDFEFLMEHGLNVPSKSGKPEVSSSKYGSLPGFPGETNFAKGQGYYLTLHVALAVFILAIVIGNIGMLLARMQVKA